MTLLNVSFVLLLRLGAFWQKSPDVQSMFEKLKAPETTVEAAAQLAAISRTRPDTLSTLAQELPPMMLESTNIPVVRSEAALAGTLRLKEATYALIVLLSRRNYGEALSTATSRIELRDDPVGRALYDIGPSVIPALAQPLEAKDASTRKRTIWILRLFNNSESRSMLQNHLARESDEGLRTFLLAIGIKP